MGIYTEAVQKLYVAYFSRPADAAGLAYWENVVTAAKGNTAAVSAAFAASQEYKDTFAGQSAYQVINTIYQNLFGRAAEADALTFWGQGLLAGKFTIDNAVTAIAAGAQDTDLVAYNSKVAAAIAFTAALDTPAEMIGYTGATANAAAKTWLAAVKDDATLKAAIETSALNASVTVVTTPVITPVNVTLTALVDTFTGGGGNDVITATTTTGAQGLTTFDVIDGAGGTDTIRFLDTTTAPGTQFALPSGASVSNVEVVNAATTGGLNLDTTVWTGVTAINATAGGTAAVAVKAAGTTDVTVGSATTSTTGVTGGRAVNVALTDATAGDVTVTGAALTNVTIKGGAVATVDNLGGTSGTTTATGKTLTNVTLDGVNGATAALKGAALTNVSLKNIDQATAVTITNGTADHALNLSVEGVGYDAAGAAVVVSVADAKAATVNVAANSKSNVAVSAAVAKTVNVTGTAALALDVAAVAAATSINASAASGGVTLTGIAAGVTSITTGTGKDKFTVTADTTADNKDTSTDETVNATVDSGAGDDTITIATTGTGKVTVNAGAGNDKVTIASRGTEVLNIDLGEGNDTLDAAVAITATDVINAGAGTDTLALKLVGSANIGAFSGFDLFDAAGLGRTLDVDILATKNTVSEIVASASVAGVAANAALTNVGAGVGVRVTGDMAASTLAITQKAAGALTVTVDADETGTADTTIDTITAAVDATNATSLKAVFDTSFLAKITGETTTGDNVATLNLSGVAASLEIVSGGELANNVLNYNDTNATDKLATVTVSGASDLSLSVTSTALTSVNASALTGDLTFSTANLKDGGSVTLGSGADRIAVAATGAALESIVGFEKASATAVNADATAEAQAAAIADADMLSFGALTAVANASAVTGGAVSAKGILTFTGAGPSTLDDAISIANLAAETAGEALVFQYLNDSYVFVQGATDIVVKLTGTTGITQIFEGAVDQFILI